MDADNEHKGPKEKQWHQLVRAERDKGRSYSEAVEAVERSNPGLREAMIAEANAGRRSLGS
jgi:hypothetical protein